MIFEPGILAPNGFLLGNDFRSWYHSFQAQASQRFSKGLTVSGAYTLFEVDRYQFHLESRGVRGQSV